MKTTTTPLFKLLFLQTCCTVVVGALHLRVKPVQSLQIAMSKPFLPLPINPLPSSRAEVVASVNEREDRIFGKDVPDEEPMDDFTRQLRR